MLVGVRLNHDTMRSAYKKFTNVGAVNRTSSTLSVKPSCSLLQLEISAGADGRVKSVLLEDTNPEAAGVMEMECLINPNEPKVTWGTGSGLLIESPCTAAAEIYGAPESDTAIHTSNATRRMTFQLGASRGKLTDVLEVECYDGRVVKMMLSASKD